MNISDLKKQISLARVVGEFVQLRPQGKALVGLCPFHAEKNPSFNLYQQGDEWKWKCFTGCGGGDHIDFLQKIHGCDQGEAIAKLKAMLGAGRTASLDKGRAFAEPLTQKQSHITWPLSQWQRFVDALWESQNAGREYLALRGINEETARRMLIGYAPSGAKLASPEEKESYDSPWVGFPYIVDGKVVAVKWRAVNELPDEQARYRGQPGMSTEALFNQEAIDPIESVFVTEGELDAITISQAGFSAVSISSASRKLSPAAKEALLGAERVYLAGDHEESGVGMRAMDRLLKDLGERAHILLWPRAKGEKKKDANDFFLRDCSGNVDEFRRRLTVLQAEARKPNSPHFRAVCDIIAEQRAGVKPADNPNRLRAPWKPVDQMALIIPGDIVGIFASQTGTGKSALCTQWMLYNAEKFDKSVLIYTPDLKPERHTRMIVSQLSRTNRLQLGDSDFDNATSRLENKFFYLGYDTSASNPKDVLDICEQGIRRLGGDILVIDTIDYVLRSTGDRRIQAGDELIARAGNMAAKYGIIVILVTQPRTQPREAGKSRDHWAEIEDMKYGAALREDAAAVIHLHRQRIGEPKQKEKDNFDAEQMLSPKTLVRMLKGREQNEGRQSCYLHFKGEIATFYEIENGQQDMGIQEY